MLASGVLLSTVSPVVGALFDNSMRLSSNRLTYYTQQFIFIVFLILFIVFIAVSGLPPLIKQVHR
jgi:hypothetical protein